MSTSLSLPFCLGGFGLATGLIKTMKEQSHPVMPPLKRFDNDEVFIMTVTFFT